MGFLYSGAGTLYSGASILVDFCITHDVFAFQYSAIPCKSGVALHGFVRGCRAMICIKIHAPCSVRGNHGRCYFDPTGCQMCSQDVDLVRTRGRGFTASMQGFIIG